MTGERLNVSAGAAAAAVVSLLLAGAGGTYLIMREAPVRSEEAPRAPVPSAPAEPSSGARPDVVVSLTREAVERAGIVVVSVSTDGVTAGLKLPGIVEPNAYRQVSMTPLVSGRVLRVSAQLGDRVRRGQSVAQVYSPELAEARTTYVAARAMLDAHDRELQRTQKLAEIGAASRQELERIHAEHAAQTAEVESARSRLQLLGAEVEDGASSADASATIDVPAPIDGVVTERVANPGLNVDPTTRLFTIVDLSNVWIIADVYERDLQHVREGVRANVTTRALPGVSLEGRVGYIDPQLNTATRTAKIRVEVANPRGELRLGMYAEVAIAIPGTSSVLTVPRSAIQNVADRQVVYVPVPGQPAQFMEREVRVGRTSGDFVEVLAGLSPGDSVVSAGSFFLRAEAERLGLRGSRTPSSSGSQTFSGQPRATTQAAKILVTDSGYEPDKVSLRAGVPARLTFIRTSDKTCGTEVEFPSLGLKRSLPLNEPVVIEFTPTAGEIAFACGMNMLKGAIVVQ